MCFIAYNLKLQNIYFTHFFSTVSNFKNNELRFNGEIILNLSNVIESRSSSIHEFVDFSMCKVNDYLAAIGEVIVIEPDDWDDPPAYYIFSELIFLDKNGNLYWDGN